MLFGFTGSRRLEAGKLRLRSWLRSRGRERFLLKLPRNATVLDIGCGNNSPFKIKALRPDIVYIGVDVGEYAQDESSRSSADRYVICPPDKFAETIESFSGIADAVISSHNIEHCFFPAKVLAAMCSALKPRGMLYLAFPCEASVRFPSREGCLNYFDHPQHQDIPKFEGIRELLRCHQMEEEFSVSRYFPIPAVMLGALLEPYSRISGRVLPLGLTWALFGFESVIWCSRRI